MRLSQVAVLGLMAAVGQSLVQADVGDPARPAFVSLCPSTATA